MPRNKKVKREHCVDESMLDPRLRSDAGRTQGSENKTEILGAGFGPGPAPASGPSLAHTDAWWETFEDDICDENTVFPESAFKSLDFLIESENMGDDERTWLMGMQAGIGLGIISAREALLNEMQNENTVFGRPIQQQASDPDPFTMRMAIGQLCQIGFDRRVAYRAANRYLKNCEQIADTVVYNGLTSCLPETGNHMIGTSTFFSDEDVARCHANSRVIKETLGMSMDQPQPNPGVEQPTPLTASFLGDGPSIGGVDMTQLTGTAALIANAAMHGIGGNGLGMRNGQHMTGGPGPAPHVSHPTQHANPSGQSGNDGAAFKV
ncbi:hypothetical protein F5Y03DRAFT_223928 [Xylaria venustula]|nr:hypothetical protein F5Y03DRAFT_223928 [Xylaria venustula]